jgi:hypothetical protein
LVKEWGLDQLREIQYRRYILRKTAVEVFLLDTSSLLINFPGDASIREDFCQKLIKLRKTKCPNL